MSFIRNIFLVFIAIFVFVSTVSAQTIPVGQAAVVRGDVYVERAGEKIKLKSKDKVFQGDKILTGEKGKVQVIFADDSIFTIGRDAEILLDNYVYNPKTNVGKSKIKAKKGTFKFVTGKIAKNNYDNVKVITPFATIGVRGSGGIVDIAPNGETTLGLTQCCLDLSSNGATGVPPVPLETVNSFSRVEDPSSPPTPPAPMPPAMLASMNGDLAGGFAPEEGGDEGDNADNANPPPPAEDDSSQPPLEDDNQASNNEGNLPPLEGTENQQAGNEEGISQPINDAPPSSTERFDNEPVTAQGDSFASFESFAEEGGDAPLASPLGFVDNDPILSTENDPAPLQFESFDSNIDTTQTTQDNTANEVTTVDSTTFTHNGIFTKRNTAGVDITGSLAGKFLDAGGFFGEFTASDGAVFNGILPTADNAGDFNFSTIAFDNKSFSGTGFRTLNGSMVMYNLTDDVTNERLSITTGTTLSAAELPITGQVFFNFQPDFLGGNEGFFNSGTGTTDANLMVDFDAKTFFGGKMIIDNTTKDYSLNVGFGEVGKSGSSNLMDGLSYSFDANSTEKGVYGVGTIEVDTVYGEPSLVDGFLIKTTTDVGNDFTATNLTTNTNINPAVVTDPPPNGIGSRTDTSLTGFAAGHLRRNVGGIEDVSVVSNGSAIGNVSISKNAAANTIGATLNLSAKTNKVNASFGNSNPNIANSFVADNIYAMEQGSLSFDINNNGTSYNVNEFSGVLVSDVVAENKCDACQFAHWGVWAAKVSEGSGGGQNPAYQDVVQLLPYVVGDPTTNTQYTALGSAPITHNGIMFGSIADGAGNITNEYGAFNLTGTFNSGFSFTGNIADYNIASSSNITGAETFSSNVNITDLAATSIGTGTINGAFFGASAQDVGGNFDFTAGTTTGAGIFIGTNQ